MVPAVHYLKALRLRARFMREMDRLFERYDLIVLPTQMDTPPPWEESTGDPKFNEQLTFSAHPALTLPVGRGEGNLPIGIQLGGALQGVRPLRRGEVVRGGTGLAGGDRRAGRRICPDNHL